MMTDSDELLHKDNFSSQFARILGPKIVLIVRFRNSLINFRNP